MSQETDENQTDEKELPPKKNCLQPLLLDFESLKIWLNDWTIRPMQEEAAPRVLADERPVE